MLKKAKKLISRLTAKETAWRSLVETALILGGLFFINEKKSSIFLFVFAIAAVWLYFLQSKERRFFRSSFFITSILGAIFFGFVLSKDVSIYLKLPLLLIIGTIFFIIFGLSNTLFTKKRRIYSLINAILGICLTGASIMAAKNNTFGLFLVISIGITLILKEYLTLESENQYGLTGVKTKNSRLWTMGTVGALLTAESIFFIKSLPLPIFSFLGLISLFFVVIRKLEKDHIKGVLRLNTCLEQALILVCGIIIALVNGRWGR